MTQQNLPLADPESEEFVKALDEMLGESNAKPAPRGITSPQPLEPPCLQKSHSRSSSS